MRALQTISTLFKVFVYEQHRRILGLYAHHQSKPFTSFHHYSSFSSGVGLGMSSLSLGGNSANGDYGSQNQNEEKSAVNKFGIDVLPDRNGTGSIKWDLYRGKDILPMWVADADVPPAPAITESLICRTKSGTPFGYTRATDEVRAAVASHIASFGPPNFIPKKGLAYPPRNFQIYFLPGLIQGLVFSCGINEPGSAVMVLTPIYPPFLWTPERAGCKMVEVPLKMGPVAGAVKERWTFDMDAMEAAKKANPNMRMLLLCNPHNPVGRCFTVEELRKVGEFCERHDMIIVSDEIHSQIILDEDVQHQPMVYLDGGEFSDRTITLGAPSKTYNIPGLCSSWAYIPNSNLMRRYRDMANGYVGANNNLFGYVATEAAYTKCEPWRRAFLSHLRSNRDLVYNFIKEKMPELHMEPMQATYLAWINASGLGWKNPHSEFEEHGVGLCDGPTFGAVGINHVRLNFACPRERLLEALRRMENAVKSARSLKHSDA